MKTLSITVLSLLCLLFSCKNMAVRKQGHDGSDRQFALQTDTTDKNLFAEALATIPPNITPVFGHRFIITGDFDGNGIQDSLTEHFVSRINHQEAYKFYDSLDEEQSIALTIQKNPYAFGTFNGSALDTLPFALRPRNFGLYYLKNEGDLNGDGTDEISYVVNWADWSSTNTLHIVTFKNKQWQTLYSFPMWEWQLPDLPQHANTYGPFGLEAKVVSSENDSTSQAVLQDQEDLPALVKKLKTNKIRIIFRNDEAMQDTMMVRLRKGGH